MTEHRMEEYDVEDLHAVQFYATKRIDLEEVTFKYDPYKQPAMIEKLQKNGIWFWRDEDHGKGLVNKDKIETPFIAYYSQLMLTPEGEIYSIMADNLRVRVKWYEENAVCRNFIGREDA